MDKEYYNSNKAWLDAYLSGPTDQDWRNLEATMTDDEYLNHINEMRIIRDMSASGPAPRDGCMVLLVGGAGLIGALVELVRWLA